MSVVSSSHVDIESGAQREETLEDSDLEDTQNLEQDSVHIDMQEELDLVIDVDSGCSSRNTHKRELKKQRSEWHSNGPTNLEQSLNCVGRYLSQMQLHSIAGDINLISNLKTTLRFIVVLTACFAGAMPEAAISQWITDEVKERWTSDAQVVVYSATENDEIPGTALRFDLNR